ncbi:universal stress protein [Maridesulfovibrio hydrothermalis]|uniref:UspA domain protein n=1 Tax=Maridesulfovibrio hydrothermalis AM13 = DSM 14728 TaxID=1121451 RepID=L0RGR1_9BACT|nr:universal stress protein [Maridesulfovibrio hydrothermalis]CCO24781.1 UspA domain protein [Maridesulfovibrio hydrothermalis AM13 = DSM 14728]
MDTINMKMLVAFDGSENSFKAINYVGGVARNCAGCEIVLLYVERLPDKDLFSDDKSWKDQCEKNEHDITIKLTEARKKLVSMGVSEEEVEVEYFASCKSPFHETDVCSTGRSIGMDILRLREEGGYGTIVIGRRGVSKAEEFLFGSVSTKVVQSAVDCTVWVVS